MTSANTTKRKKTDAKRGRDGARRGHDCAERAGAERDLEIDRAIRRVLRARGVTKTACPSEVARAVYGDAWRAGMKPVRARVEALAARGEVLVLQRGQVVRDPSLARGAIRIGHPDRARASYADAYRGVDLRAHPERYRVGRGEQGVLVAEPYKSELLPFFRVATVALAKRSIKALRGAFLRYLRARDFVGMDMARKYLQMGYTRARRYASHASGRKWSARSSSSSRSGTGDARRRVLAREPDDEKAAVAELFYAAWRRTEAEPTYARWLAEMRASERARARPSAPTSRRTTR